MTGQFGFKILNEPRAYYENNSIAYNRLKFVQRLLTVTTHDDVLVPFFTGKDP